jgi:hypothetical protein
VEVVPSWSWSGSSWSWSGSSWGEKMKVCTCKPTYKPTFYPTYLYPTYYPTWDTTWFVMNYLRHFLLLTCWFISFPSSERSRSQLGYPHIIQRGIQWVCSWCHLIICWFFKFVWLKTIRSKW